MQRRRLKVTPTPPERRGAQSSLPPPIPFLRLRGRWLDRAGFTIGSHVRVAVAPGLIALEVIDEPDRD